MNCYCCGTETGSKVVCDACRPKLSTGKHVKMRRIWHQLVCERDHNTCVYCEYSPPNGFHSGEICGNHKETQGSRPDLVFDVTNGECTCKPCNQQFSFSAPTERKKAMLNRKPSKRPKCKCRPQCPLLPGPNGYCVLSSGNR